jgi:hypothetical protein
LEGSNIKIIDRVEALVKTPPRRNHLQYLLAMDNFFTQPSVVEMTRREGVGLVGTARRQRNWPPRTYKAIDDKWYNTLYPSSRPKNVWKRLSKLYLDGIIFSICLPWTTSSHNRLL